MGASGRHGAGSRRLVALLTAVAAVALAMFQATSAPPARALGVQAVNLTNTQVRAADYWTETFSNPLDFDDPADMILADEGPMQGIAGHTISGGFLNLTLDESSGSYFSPIWGGYPGAADHGREGSFRTVDTSRWRYLLLRIQSSTDIAAGVRWYTCESGVSDSCQGGFPFQILASEGPRTYAFDLTDASLSNGDPSLKQPWSGRVTGLRIAFGGTGGADLKFDWIRLLSEPEPGGNMATTGERVGPIPQVLNPDDAGAIPVVYNPDGTVLTQVDTHACGDYAIAARNGDSWDFNSASDVQQVFNLSSWKVQNGWFEGKSVASPSKPGDPGVQVRLGGTPIDPSKYRHATTVIPKTEGTYSQKFAEGGGWVIRWLWKFVGIPNKWQVSRQLAQYPNEKVISVDLVDPNPYDGVAAKPSDIADTEHKGGEGWNVPGRLVNVFRYDPHEDYAPRSFWIDQLWLATDDCSGSPFDILFRDNNWAPNTKADIWADTDPNGFNGQMVASNITVNQGLNSYSWTPQASGKFWVWIVMHRNGSDGRSYATGPVDMSVDPCVAASTASSSTSACKLTLTKDVTSPPAPAPAALGDTVRYKLVATNAGKVPLHEVSVSDPMLGALSCSPAVPVATLAPGAKITCTGQHTVVTADYQGNATLLVNTAQATTKEIKQPTVATARVKLAPPIVLSLTKQVTSATPPNGYGPGASIAYKLVATNGGTGPITGVTVSDPAITGLSCVPTIPATLAPAAKLTCTGQHVVNQGDVDAPGASFVNTAKATATGLKQPVTATASAPLDDRTSMAIDKKVTSPKGPGPYAVGDTVTYAIVVTNTGARSLTGVGVSDPTVQDLVCGLALPVPALPSGGTLTCTAQHQITAADVTPALAYKNTATATAKGLKPVSDSVTVRLLQLTTTETTTTEVPVVTTSTTTTTIPGTTTTATTTTTTSTTAPKPTTTKAGAPSTTLPVPTTAPALVIPSTTLPGSPTLELTPSVGPTGFVARAVGTGFPANTLIALRWQGGYGGATVRSGPDGSFTIPVLIFPNDALGPRLLVWVDQPAVNARFLVVAGPMQPGGSDAITPHRVRYGR